MKFEHRLEPELANHARQALTELAAQRRRYLLLMGEAAEMERQVALTSRALDSLLFAVVKLEGLPASVTPYQFAPDGSAITGESAE